MPSRNDPKFKIFHDINLLLQSENKVIDLPNFGTEFAKDMNVEKQKISILTPQRISILIKFMEMVNMGKPTDKNYSQKGMIISGPNGVGKTFMTYLMACAAYANNCILVYIVCIKILYSINKLLSLNVENWQKLKTMTNLQLFFFNVLLALTLSTFQKFSVKH